MPYAAFVSLSLAMIIVGSSVVAGRIMIEELPVFLASTLRFALAALVLAPLLYLREGGFPRISRRSLLLLGLQALFGSFLFTVFLLAGLRHTSPASAGIITSTTPACMGLMAWIFFKERPSAAVVAGIILAVTGILCLNLLAAAPGDEGPHPLWGNLLVLCAVVVEALFLLLRKTVREPLSPLAAATIITLFGLAYFTPAGLIQAAGFPFSGLSLRAWFSVAYYGLFVTVLAYLFWFAGIVRVKASLAGVFTGLMPLSALACSALVLGNPLRLAHGLGCACVLAGILVISAPCGCSRTAAPLDAVHEAQDTSNSQALPEHP